MHKRILLRQSHPERLLSEFLRVLKPNGRLVLGPTLGPTRIWAEQVTAHLSAVAEERGLEAKARRLWRALTILPAAVWVLALGVVMDVCGAHPGPVPLLDRSSLLWGPPQCGRLQRRSSVHHACRSGLAHVGAQVHADASRVAASVHWGMQSLIDWLRHLAALAEHDYHAQRTDPSSPSTEFPFPSSGSRWPSR